MTLSEPYTCSACGVEWENHRNVIHTCQEKAEAIRELERMKRIVAAYVDALSNHPQVAGELFRELQKIAGVIDG